MFKSNNGIRAKLNMILANETTTVCSNYRYKLFMGEPIMAPKLQHRDIDRIRVTNKLYP